MYRRPFISIFLLTIFILSACESEPEDIDPTRSLLLSHWEIVKYDVEVLNGGGYFTGTIGNLMYGDLEQQHVTVDFLNNNTYTVRKIGHESDETETGFWDYHDGKIFIGKEPQYVKKGNSYLLITSFEGDQLLLDHLSFLTVDGKTGKLHLGHLELIRKN